MAALSVLGRILPKQASPEVPGPPCIEVAVLDGLRLSLNGAPVILNNRKARAMLAYLALEGGAPVSREQLAGLFWGEAPERQARNSLRQSVFELRDALQQRGCQALVAGRDSLALSPGSLALDIDAVLAAIGAGVPPTAGAALGRADRMLAGYEDLSPLFRDWVGATRIAVQSRLQRALEGAFADEAAPRRTRRAMAEALLRLDPTHEDACRTVMRLAAEDGEIGVALRSYAALYEVLGAEFDQEPSVATQRLVAEIKRGETELPVPPALGPAPLPAEPLRDRRRALTAEDAPVVAVLPFRVLGGGAEPDYLAEGIVEDIVHLLAGLREPVVISASSTRRFQDVAPDDLTRLAELLGADYLVTGSVRLRGEVARLVVELAEASQGAVLWSRVIEVAPSALFEAQAQIAAGIANALVPCLNQAELRATRRRAPEDLGAYHLMLRARASMFEFTVGPFEEAGVLLERARARDPDYAPIYASMIEWRCYRIFQGWSPDREADIRALEEAAKAALSRDPGHARALALYGHNRTIIGHHYDEALGLLDRAVASGPNDAETLIWTVPTLAYVGRGEEAVGRARRAIALSPQDPLMFRYEHFLSIAHYAAGDLEAAARIGLAAAARHPNFTSNLRMTVAALAGLGRLAEAAPLVERLMALQPALRVGQSLPRYAFRDGALRERHARWLRLAGVPG